MRIGVKIGVVVVLLLIIALMLRRSHPNAYSNRDIQTTVAVSTQAVISVPAVATNAATNQPRTKLQMELKHRLSEFTTDEKSAFQKDFETRYKPAIQKWASAFDGRIPFAPDAVTADKLSERIGRNETYQEYVFVIDGVTLGVEDKKGVARVDYVNNPKNTRRMMQAAPNEAPIVQSPVSRDEIATMLEKESGRHFAPQDIRMTPSGLSGGLNGGVMVNVGGDPDNGASWDYEMVFAPDGKLAYYLRGI